LNGRLPFSRVPYPHLQNPTLTELLESHFFPGVFLIRHRSVADRSPSAVTPSDLEARNLQIVRLDFKIAVSSRELALHTSGVGIGRTCSGVERNCKDELPEHLNLSLNTDMVQKEQKNRLLEWYRENRRDLPWRMTRDPYAIWISETMLQQTT